MKYTAAYKVFFDEADNLTQNVLRFAPDVGSSHDHFRADLAGLLATAYCSTFENCIKSIFIAFAADHNQILQSVIESIFRRINSKISIDAIENRYIASFGVKYKTEYSSVLNREESRIFRTQHVSMRNCYRNISTWRHAYAHECKKLATLEEITSAFVVSKNVIVAIDRAMSI